MSEIPKNERIFSRSFRRKESRKEDRCRQRYEEPVFLPRCNPCLSLFQHHSAYHLFQRRHKDHFGVNINVPRIKWALDDDVIRFPLGGKSKHKSCDVKLTTDECVVFCLCPVPFQRHYQLMAQRSPLRTFTRQGDVLQHTTEGKISPFGSLQVE